MVSGMLILNTVLVEEKFMEYSKCNQKRKACRISPLGKRLGLVKLIYRFNLYTLLTFFRIVSLGVKAPLPTRFSRCKDFLKFSYRNLSQRLWHSVGWREHLRNGDIPSFSWALETGGTLPGSRRGSTVAAARLQPLSGPIKRTQGRRFRLNIVVVDLLVIVHFRSFPFDGKCKKDFFVENSVSRSSRRYKFFLDYLTLV